MGVTGMTAEVVGFVEVFLVVAGQGGGGGV